MAVKHAIIVEMNEFEKVRSGLDFIKEMSKHGIEKNAERDCAEVLRVLMDIQAVANNIDGMLFR